MRTEQRLLIHQPHKLENLLVVLVLEPAHAELACKVARFEITTKGSQQRAAFAPCAREQLQATRDMQSMAARHAIDGGALVLQILGEAVGKEHRKVDHRE